MKRKLTWAVSAVVLLSGTLWFGGWAGWRLYDEAFRHGCIPLSADVTRLALRTAQTGRVRFAALGDAGTGNAGARRVAGVLRRVCAGDGCDFVVLLGDNFYPDGVNGSDDPRFVDAFESVYEGLTVPVLAILGNHDVHQPPVYQVFHTLRSPLWRMPNFEYDFQAGPARFFALNTNCAHLPWRRLGAKLDAPYDGWTVVLGHHSLYAEGPHGDGPWPVLALWNGLKSGVDFYLAGHNHLLEHLQREGERTDYVVSGTAGADLPDPAHMAGPSAAQRRFLSRSPGFAWLELTAAQATLRFYDERGEQLYEAVRQKPAR